MDWTFGLGVTVAIILGIVLILYGKEYILKGLFNFKKSSKNMIAWAGVIWVAIIVITGGYLGFLSPAVSPVQTGVVPADYVVTTSDSIATVTTNDLTHSITVLLDRNGSANWENNTQYCNATFAISRVDAGTSDSAVVADVTQVDSWIDTNGITRNALQKYANGQFYADFNQTGTGLANDKMSVVIDRSVSSSVSINMFMVADLASWSTAVLGDSHSVILTLSDPASAWSQTWTINFILNGV